MNRRQFLCSVTAVGGALAQQQVFGADNAPPFQLNEFAVIDPKMSDVEGVCFDAEDRMYVAGSKGVNVYDPDGVFLHMVKSSGPAIAVAVNDEGNLFAAQRAKIEKFDSDGAKIGEFGTPGKERGQFTRITGLAVSGYYVYVADGAARRLSRFASDGDFIDDMEGFLAPSGRFDCAAGRDGILHVGHRGKHRVEKYTPTGELIEHWGEFGTAPEKFCGCCNPANLAVFADGRIATFEKGIPRLKVYDGSGKLLAYLASKDFPAKTDWMSLAVDSKDRIAMADSIGGKVHLYELERLPEIM